MLITVTQEHIDKGEIRNSQCCPIALALKDTFKVNTVSVSAYSTNIGMFPDEVFAENLPLPEVARDWIHNFDTYNKIYKKAVLPFTFELDLTPHSGNTTKEGTNVG